MDDLVKEFGLMNDLKCLELFLKGVEPGQLELIKRKWRNK
jgi:hypothetical protein